jgi:glyoxylase-like metal-dependent hydrolase (beta-lactamase superfamily II)
MKLADNLHAFLWQSMTTNNCNAYLIDGPARILIDPGHRAHFDHVQRGLEQLELNAGDIDLVVCTHAHPDHIEAVPLVKNTQPLFALHKQEWQWASTIGKQMAVAYGIDIEEFQPDFFLGEGTLSVKGLELEIIHTPGHSPGSVSIYWPAQKALFTGDLIFKEGVGRTDLPGGDGSQLKESIKGLTQLDVEWLLSGHGDVISGSDKVRKNFDEVESFYFAYV